jgi:hypothetical protein
MPKQEKISAIVEAAKVYPKSRIDEGGKGKAVKKLLDGQNVSEEKLDEMLTRIGELGKGDLAFRRPKAQAESQGESKHEPNEQDFTQTTAGRDNAEQDKKPVAEASIEESKGEGKQANNMAEIKAIMTGQSEQIKALQDGFSQVISALNTLANQDNVTQIRQDITQIKDKLKSFETSAFVPANMPIITQYKDKIKAQKEIVMSFALCQKSTITKGKKYLKWYASKRIDGKQVWVYLGEDTSQAETKIKAWLEKHPGKVIENK